MQVNEQYVSGVYSGKAYTVQNHSEETNRDFLAALTNQMKGSDDAYTPLHTAMDASGYVIKDASWYQPGVLREVTEEEKLELGRTANGENLSPEAKEKQEALMARLNQLCARNPNVYYKVNGDIFQKMADDPAFEKKIYATIDAFEQSGAAAMSVSPTSVSALYMGALGDWVMMTSELDGEDWESSHWTVSYGSADGVVPASAEEVVQRFPTMDDALAQVVADNLTLDTEGEMADILAEWRQHWEEIAAGTTPVEV